MSIGLAIRATGMNQFPDLLKVADQVLYSAKNSGRNVVRTADDPAPSAQWCELARPGAESAPVKTAPLESAVQPPIDMQMILQRCCGDAEFAKAVTDRFQGRNGPEQIDLIQKGLTDLNGKNGLPRAAHSLKSMTAYVAADTASDLARQIEKLGTDKQFAEIEPLLASLRKGNPDNRSMDGRKNSPSIAAQSEQKLPKQPSA